MNNVRKMVKMSVCFLLAMLLTFQGLIPALERRPEPQPNPASLSYALAEEEPEGGAAEDVGGVVPEGATNDLDGSKIEGIKLVWVTTDSRTNNDGEPVSQKERDDKTHLYLATTSSSPLSMIYKLEVEFSGQYDYAPGDITITLPAQVWQGRKYEATGENGETVGVVDKTKLLGELELPLPAAPSKRADFNWQIIDGNYVLTNTRTIGATSSVSMEVAIRNVYPMQVVDMSETIPITAHCEVVTNQGNTIELNSTPITAQLDTCAKITSAYKDGSVYEDYPGGFSDEMLAKLPEGTSPDDYIYVRWYTYHSHVNNQPFSLDLADVLSDAYENVRGQDGKLTRQKVTDGIFLGVTNYPETNLQPEEYLEKFFPEATDPEAKGSKLDLTQLDATAEIVDHDMSSTSGTQYSHTAYMWSAYRKDAFYVPRANEPQRVYYFENDVEWNLTETDKAVEADEWDKPADPQKLTNAYDKVVLPYAPVRFSRPTGHFAVNKWTEQKGYKDWLYGYALNKLENKEPVDMKFVVETIGYGYPWTSPRTFGVGDPGAADNAQLNQLDLTEADFGLLGWKQITHDFQTFFNYETTPLTSEDFEMTGLIISVPSKMRYAKNANGTWSYKSDSSLPTPDLLIEYQLNNNEDTWYKAAVATWGEDGYGAFEFKELSADCTASGMTIHFPKNVTDVRHTFVSNVFNGKTAEKCDIAMLDWYVYPLITMKPSERARQIVKELFEQSENPSTKFKNDVIMDVYGWVGDDGKGKLVLDDDFDSSLATYAGASYGVSLNKSGSYRTDVENQRLLINYTATLTEQSNLRERKDYDSAVEDGVIPAETSGVWYDLLPPHVVPLLDTVKLRAGDTITNLYTIENYKDTGRILLVVEAELTPKPTKVNGIGYADQPWLSFNAAYTWLDMDEYGRNLVNYVAFESTVENLRADTLGTIKNQKGEPDSPLGGNNATTPSMPADIVAAMTGLNPNTKPGENRFVYGKCANSVSALTYAVSGLDKMVSNDLVGIWTQGLDNQEQVTVYEGHGYTYRLRVSSAENTSTKGIIIYDTIENYIIPDPNADIDTDATKRADYEHTQERKDWSGDWQGKGQWRGTLNKVDLSEFVNAGVAPVLLYSELPGLQFADSSSGSTDDNFDEDTELFASGAYDITDRSIWKVAQLDANGIWTVPSGVNVSAIAIDATTNADGTEFVLEPEEKVSGYLRMVAPDDNSDPDVWHAKGAYARTESGDVDWEAAQIATNNMYAYNNARVRLIQGQTDEDGTTWLSNYRMIRNDYTRVGILPGVLYLEKAWQDQNNHDGMRPETVTVAVERRLADLGEEAQPVLDNDGQPVKAVLDESNSWKAQFNQLDLVNEQGVRYLYSFVEEPVEGYESKVEFVDMNHFKLVNVHPNEQVTISGEKVWNDDDNAYGVRPQSVTIKLYRDGEYVASRTVTPDADGYWTYTFGKLDKYAEGGKEYTYTVEEEYVPKYADTVVGYQLVNNTYQPYGDLAISKTVVGATPKALEKAFTFTLVLLAEQTDPDAAVVPLMDKYPYILQQKNGDEWVDMAGDGATGTIGNGDNFQLKADQRLLVKNLPSESTYQVVETEMAGFTTTSTGADGIIEAGETNQAEFTNTYTAKGTAQLQLDKELTGRQIRKNQFRFELVDNNPDSPTHGEAIRTARVDAPETTTGGVGKDIESAAKAIFGQLEYTEADAGKTFHYIVREVNMGAGGYGYDAKEYAVTVAVADENGDGTLTVTPTFAVDGNAADELAFENTYTATGEVVLKAWKVLDGRPLTDGEFTFELFPYDVAENKITDKCIGTAKNDDEGNVVFGALTFDQNDVSLSDDEPATYTYLMREQQGTDKTVNYSDQAYIITLQVYDNGDGTLSFVQDQQSGKRALLDCPDCDGGFSGDVETTVPYGKGIKYITYYGDTSTPYGNTGDTYESIDLCKVCHGLAYIGGKLCETCKGSGLLLGGCHTFNSGTFKYVYLDYVQLFDSQERWFAKGSGNNGVFYYQTIPSELGKIYKKCPTCDGTGGSEGPLVVTGETTMPVFENTLKPGNLSITKQVQGTGSSNPDQEFTFHVKLTSDETIELDYTVSGPEQAALLELEQDNPASRAGATPSSKRSTPYTASDLSGEGMAVLNASTGEFVFFRATRENDTFTYNGKASGGEDIVVTMSDKSQTVVKDGITYYFYRGFESLGSNCSDSSWPWYDERSQVRTVSMEGDIKPNTTRSMFYEFRAATDFELSRMDTHNVTSMYRMFIWCESVRELDLRAFDTSKVTTIRALVNVCYKLERVDLSSFDTSNVTEMGYLFSGDSALKEINISHFDTSNVTNMEYLFRSCNLLTEIDLSNFDTSKVTNMSNMFYNCDNLQKLDIGHFDTTQVTNFSDMFGSNSKLSEISIGKNTKLPNYPSVPSNEPYNGQWMNIYNADQLMTSAELFPSGNHEGTWIWNTPTYKMNFDPDEGAGAMRTMWLVPGKAYSFEPTFYRFGYDLTGFTDGTATYAVQNGKCTIPEGNSYEANQEYTLTALWQPREGLITQSEDGYTIQLKAGETFTFNNLPVNTAYEVWEETPAGWVLVRKVDETGAIKPLETSEAVFTNEYNPNKATATLRATKLMDGKGAAENAFTFTLSENGQVLQTKKNAAGGGITFDLIEYTKDDKGEHIYTIAEIAGNDSTITYDDHSYTVTVTVDDDGEGNLSATVVYNTTDKAAPVFENTTKPGSLTIQKTLKDETDAAEALVAQNPFKVEVFFTDKFSNPWKGTVKVGDDDVSITDGKYETTLSGGQSITIGNIPDGVNYQVSEPETRPGWIMDTDKTGTIQSTLTKVAKLENTYTLKGVAAPSITKALVGRTLKEDEFTFRLVQGNMEIATATNGADGSVVFPDMTFEAAGDYTYRIMEVSGNDTSVSYSGDQIEVTITMTDVEGQGRLTPSYTYRRFINGVEENVAVDGHDTITNKVMPGMLKVSKTVVSQNANHKQQPFTFNLLLTDALGQPISGEYLIEIAGTSEVLTVNQGNGSFALLDGQTALITGLPHGANYAVTEVEAGGFTQKSTGATGSIVANQTAEAAFTNTYAAEGQYTPVAVKSLTGNKDLEANAFVFALLDEEGYEQLTATNDADGNVTFGTLSFTEADVGKKVYQMVEKDAGVAGYVYDDKVQTITLNIADNGNGTLSVSDDLNGQPALFTNSYSDFISHTVNKIWQDNDDALGMRPQSVTVELYRNNQKIDEAQVTAENNWTYTFDNLPAFDEQGVKYTYAVREMPVEGYASGSSTQGNATNLTNTLLGVMEIKKTVVGDLEKDFPFTLTLTMGDAPVTGSYPAVGPDGTLDVTFDDQGVYTFRLGHEESLLIQGLPVGAAYSVTETTGIAYEGEVTEGSANGNILRNEANRVVFANTEKTTTFQATKVWVGGSGPIQLTLYANGKKMDPQPAYIREGDVYTFQNLPVYDELDTVIVYSAKEKYFDGYVTIYDNVAPYEDVTDVVHDGGTIINREIVTLDFKIKKVWKGLEPGEIAPEITLTLYCNGEELDVKTPVPDGGWYCYNGLPLTYKGEPAVYTVKEKPLPGFIVEYDDEDGHHGEWAYDGETITNIKLPATGDKAPVGLAITMAVAAAVGLILLLVRNRKKK